MVSRDRRATGTNPRGKAFTLIELLVVVAILVLLMAILTPALRRAREMTRSTICCSDLRQITHSFASYANANGGYLRGSTTARPTGWRWPT